MDLSEQLAAAKARLAEAQSALSEQDTEEIAQREKLTELNAQIAAAEDKQRDLQVSRRLDEARKVLGENASIEACIIEGFPDFFLVQYDGKAHGKWERRLREAKSKQSVSGDQLAAIDRQYAVDAVYDWSAIGLIGEDPEKATRLQKYLTANPGLVTSITNVAARLAGVLAQERKS